MQPSFKTKTKFFVLKINKFIGNRAVEKIITQKNINQEQFMRLTFLKTLTT